MSDIATKIEAQLPAIVGGLCNGRPYDPNGSYLLPVINPDNGATVTQLAETNADQVEQVVLSARRTFESGIWSQASIGQRQIVLRNAASLIRDNADELAALDSLTTGLLFHKSTLRHVEAAAGWLDYFGDLIGSENDEKFRTAPTISTRVSREPAGVAALFTPWNIPLMGAALKLSAALAMGNSCVIKPSEQSPLGSLRLVELLHEAGLPEGVLHLINGRGAVTGTALAGHPDVDLISFTGGENAGRAIAQSAAGRFAKVTMELGGKSANIIFDDADHDRALDGAITSVYGNNGQACLAGSRILVHKKIADKFIADFVARTEALKIGRPFDEASDLGPQSSRVQMERVLSYIDIATDEGGEILTGGKRADSFADGCYVEPTAVLAQSNADRICQEEIFGPYAAFLIFDQDEEAVAIANDTRFGLAGYVWSGDQTRALRVANALRTGYALVNTPMIRERHAPFGGYKHSGIDREGGRWSLDFYCEAKTTVVRDDNA